MTRERVFESIIVQMIMVRRTALLYLQSSIRKVSAKSGLLLCSVHMWASGI